MTLQGPFLVNIFSFSFIKYDLTVLSLCELNYTFSIAMGGAVAQSVERATSGEEVQDSIPAVAARSRSHGLPALSRVWQHMKLSDVSLGTRPRYSLVADENVKRPNRQTNLYCYYKPNTVVEPRSCTQSLLQMISYHKSSPGLLG